MPIKKVAPPVKKVIPVEPLPPPKPKFQVGKKALLLRDYPVPKLILRKGQWVEVSGIASVKIKVEFRNNYYWLPKEVLQPI